METATTIVRFEIDDSFRPPRLLRNRHLQSLLPTLPVRRRALDPQLRPVLDASRELLLECGNGVRLQAFQSLHPHALTPRVAVLLHGWEGSAESTYVLSLAAQLYRRGFDVVRLNLRDHGATHHLNRELFHSCRLAEVVGALCEIQRRYAGLPLHLCGFSLGGNFLLRAAAQAHAAQLALARVVAISPVLEPSATLEALERAPRSYQSYFIRRWTRSLLSKQRAWPAEYDLAGLLHLRSLRQLTRELILRFTPFESLEQYLDGYAITGERLAGLTAPAVIITSLDDPIIPAADLERLPPRDPLKLVLTRYGGHCGFLERLSTATWAERRAAAELDAIA
ncbi:MAG TPA: alpha/beta fold hydrolase [Steroidobacteraceae bacterium]|nr:alpha/beta fold hydrolase [Steroidobacteraceae bacterium]